MEQKRNELSTYLSDAGLQPITPGGGYFIVADISSIGITIIACQYEVYTYPVFVLD